MIIKPFWWPAIQAAILAGEAIMEVYDRSFEVSFKADHSPITQADTSASSIINSYLEKTQIPILSEEEIWPEFKERAGWENCWIVDPLDGTKEFVKRTGEFTVNIALVQHSKAVFGIIYVPTTKMIYLGDAKAQTSIRAYIDNIDHFKDAIEKEAIELYGISSSQLLQKTQEPQPRSKDKGSSKPLRILSSVSHMTGETKAYIKGLDQQGYEISLLEVGSSLKFCMLAEGKADLYPRFGPTMEWDTAAGQAICEAVGFEVIDQATHRPMVYNRKELRNNSFVVRPRNAV